jgi:hypothetical protein
MSPSLRCRAAWALATLNYTPTPAWLSTFQAASLDGLSAVSPGNDNGVTPGDAVDLIWALQALQQRAAAGGGASGADAAAAAAGTQQLPAEALRLVCARCAKRAGSLGAARLVRLVNLLAEAVASPAAGAINTTSSGATTAPFAVPAGVIEDLSRTVSSGGAAALAAAAAAPGGGGLARLAWAAGLLQLKLANSARDDLMRRLYTQVAATVAAINSGSNNSGGNDSSVGTLSPGDTARALWAGVQLGGRWLPPQLAAFDAATASGAALAALDGPEVVLLLGGFALSGHRLSAAWLGAFQDAGLDSARLRGLGVSEVLGVLGALRDAAQQGGAAGGGASSSGAGAAAVSMRVTWLPAWAEATLGPAEVTALAPDQLALLLQLLGDSAEPARGRTAGPRAAAAVGPELHGLLCLALSRRLQELSGAELCVAARALAALGAAPADASLLPALAVRAAEKMAALSGGQAAGLVRAFGKLGVAAGALHAWSTALCNLSFKATPDIPSIQPTNRPTGEPLESRVCAKLMDSVGQMGATEAAQTLADILMGERGARRRRVFLVMTVCNSCSCVGSTPAPLAFLPCMLQTLAELGQASGLA